MRTTGPLGRQRVWGSDTEIGCGFGVVIGGLLGLWLGWTTCANNATTAANVAAAEEAQLASKAYRAEISAANAWEAKNKPQQEAKARMLIPPLADVDPKEILRYRDAR